MVRTLTSLARSAAALGAEIEFLTPEGFPSLAVPTYPGLRRRAAEPAARSPDESRRLRRTPSISPPKARSDGWCAAIAAAGKLAFTTSYTTRFPEYIAVRSIIPAAVSYAVLRHFHAAAAMTMVATASLRQELSARGFRKLGFWTRGVDTNLFNPDHPAELDLPRPIFMTMGRVAVEKNIEAFLALNLPGSKVVIGDGPQKTALEHRYPKAKFLGEKTGARFDRASGGGGCLCISEPDRYLRRGAVGGAGLRHPGSRRSRSPGPLDVIADHPIGALDRNLRSACIRALSMSREACRNFALERSWENSARQFIGNLSTLQPSRSPRATRVVAGRTAVRS